MAGNPAKDALSGFFSLLFQQYLQFHFKEFDEVSSTAHVTVMIEKGMISFAQQNAGRRNGLGIDP
jgi:hypothetical protein